MRRRGRTPTTPRDIGTPFLSAQALGAEEARLARLHGECVEGVDALLCQARPDPHVGLTGEGWGWAGVLVGCLLCTFARSRLLS